MQTKQRGKYLYDLMHARFQCTLEWEPILQSRNSHFGFSTYHCKFVHLLEVSGMSSALSLEIWTTIVHLQIIDCSPKSLVET